MNEREGALPLEQFVQAITSQLDRAQETMALKARAGLPLTFAVKDLVLDLRTHVEMTGSQVRIRPAGPGETDTSILHLALTTITRPMIEENTVVSAAGTDEPTLEDVFPDVSDDERRRLEWAGIRTVAQLRSVQRQGGAEAIQRVSDLPVDRLRQALSRATEPRVRDIRAESGAEQDGGFLARIRGANFTAFEGHPPVVRVDGQRIPVLETTDRELVVRAPADRLRGRLEVETGPGMSVTHTLALDIDALGPQPDRAPDGAPDPGGAP
jgi:hypothetical protein